MERRTTERAKWEITLCPTGTIHVHYQTGSSDYLRLAEELREVADHLAALSTQDADPTRTLIEMRARRD
jgi:hypothetical protein